MSYFQHIKSFVTGILLLAVAFVIIIIPQNALDFVYLAISLIMMIYGLRLLFYYFRMARHMVGGKTTLYQAIFVLDAALFTFSIVNVADYIVLIYLLGIFAFSGAIDILRAFEAKKNGSPIWKKKIIIGVAESGFALVLVVAGLILRDVKILVYGFAVSLISTAILRIYDAFRKTAIIFIQ